LLSMEGAIPFAWVTRDLTQSGVLGDATAATPEKGKLLVESMSDGWVQLIKDLHKFQQPKAWRKKDSVPLTRTVPSVAPVLA
jgi:creatinine amidohydrolase